jgi:hypothetical protein
MGIENVAKRESGLFWIREGRAVAGELLAEIVQPTRELCAQHVAPKCNPNETAELTLHLPPPTELRRESRLPETTGTVQRHDQRLGAYRRCEQRQQLTHELGAIDGLPVVVWHHPRLPQPIIRKPSMIVMLNPEVVLAAVPEYGLLSVTPGGGLLTH